MSNWIRGDDSTVHRFQRHSEGALACLVEIEVYDQGEADAKLYSTPGSETDQSSEETRCDSLADALDFAREHWGLDADAIPDSPSVRVNRLVLSLLADHVGTDAVYGHDVPAETRDALAAAYEALDEPGLPLTFHDCPRDGAALDRLPDDPALPPHVERLACPHCGEVYILDRDTGALDPETEDEHNDAPSENDGRI